MRAMHGKITRIEHRDLEGERERLEGFKKRAGVGERSTLLTRSLSWVPGL